MLHTPLTLYYIVGNLEKKHWSVVKNPTQAGNISRTSVDYIFDRVKSVDSVVHDFAYSYLPQKPLDLPSNTLEIEQEGVVPEQRAVLAQLDVRHAPVASPAQRLGDFALLESREEDV